MKTLLKYIQIGTGTNLLQNSNYHNINFSGCDIWIQYPNNTYGDHLGEKYIVYTRTKDGFYQMIEVLKKEFGGPNLEETGVYLDNESMLVPITSYTFFEISITTTGEGNNYTFEIGGSGAELDQALLNNIKNLNRKKTIGDFLRKEHALCTNYYVSSGYLFSFGYKYILAQLYDIMLFIRMDHS